MKRYIVKYGVYGALISIALGLLNWYTIAQYYGPTASQIVGWIAIYFSLLCVPLGMLHYRNIMNDGFLSFGKGMRIGLGISFVASIINAFYSYLFFLIEGEDFKEWNKRGLSEVELMDYEQRMAAGPDFVFDPWFQGIVFFFMVFVSGIIVSLISTAVLKRIQ